MSRQGRLRRYLFALIALVLGAGAISGVHVSGASFVSSTNTQVGVTAAPDWTPPTAAMTDPGTFVSGTVTLSATAADDKGQVASVLLQYAPSGTGPWQTICTDSVAPYSCDWNTTTLADGSFDLRAVATDDSGYSAASDSLTTRVANSAQVVLTDPGDNLRGKVTLSAAVTGLPGGAKFEFSYSLAGANSWTTICPQAPTFKTSTTCSWNTAPLADTYDVRVVATSSGTPATVYTDVEPDVLVDNAPPTVALAVPSGTLNGTVNLVVTASDADSGIASVEAQYRAQGTPAWKSCGTAANAPYSCQLDTTGLTDGNYDFRAVATDVAGNQATTATVTRAVNNTVSSVSVTAPADGDVVRGTVTLTAAGNSNRGVTQVQLQVKPTAGSTWTTVCTDVASPYTCPWDTSAITTATQYDVRAVLLDGSGATTTSAVISVKVDNSTLRALDIQAVNVLTSGKPATGDQLVFTYSAVVDTTTIKPGWNGVSTPVTATFLDNAAPGSPDAARDSMSVGGTNLGYVTFAQDYVPKKKTAAFTGSTMVAETRSVNGTNVTVVTVTLGVTTAMLSTPNTAGAMVWTPSTAVRTLTGISCSANPATESGASDKDL